MLFRSGEREKAASLNHKMLPIVKACFQPTTPSPVPLKAALNAIGVEVGGLRLPLVEASDKERETILNALKAYGLLA